ncbi:MAG: hypothetical protein LBF81_05635 [Prevotellaceae bacterium]|jgi:hypothetical protein|nr:hypothetical protein [Prevotellaceae bacterium]
MKKLFFLFTMLVSIATSAQRTTPVTIVNTKVDYSTKVVTFDLSWKGSDANHRDEVWVFVDIQPVTGANTLGSWSPATLVPNSTTVTASSGNQYSSLTYTPVSNNTRGVWVEGAATNTASTFAATVKVKLAPATPDPFNACVYVTDYPPQAVAYSGGTYTLKGTQPFTITGNGTIQGGNKYAGSVITSMTDPTGCPGGVGRDEVHNGGTCTSGLTAIGSYCRDLTADEATYTTCSGTRLEVKKKYSNNTSYNGNSSCPSGWRLPTGTEAKCLYSAGLLQAAPWIWLIDGSSLDCTCQETADLWYSLHISGSGSCTGCGTYANGKIYAVGAFNTMYNWCIRE